MISSRRTRSQRGAAVVIGMVIVVLVLVLLVFAAAWWIAAAKRNAVRRGWAETLGSREQVLAAWPVRGTNAGALELERLAAALGIDLAPRGLEDRERPSPEAAEAFRAIRTDLGAWVGDQLDGEERAIAPVPGPVAAFLAERGAELEAVRAALLTGEPPRWQLELDRLHEASLPNLLGHLDLQRVLLANALSRSRGGDDAAALADLEAGWRLNAALRRDPVLIEQLVAIAIARMQAGALRQLRDVPAAWRGRLHEHDHRGSFLAALELEGWIWAEAADELALAQRPKNLLRRVLGTVGRPYLRYCMSDVSGQYRQRLERLAGLEVLCDADLSRHGADLDIEIPRWNVARTLVPNVADAIDRLRRLELDLELTARILELREGAASHVTDSAAPSRSCPGDRWLYTVQPDGAVSVVFSREIAWPGQRFLILPTRFTVR